MSDRWRLFESRFGSQIRASDAAWARSLSLNERIAIVEDLYGTARQAHERASDWDEVEDLAWQRALDDRRRFVAALHGLRKVERGPTPLADAG